MKDWRIVAVLFVGGIALTMVRRWGNDDPNAGVGVAGWTMVGVIVYVVVS